ncbi:hypothetical protein [Actinomadura sp. GTD37]|uniref:hypothetical protein n=1 Tax=Actinomadura sp. GTD37 TaxID=1778030 RepID=UPI0035C26265
MDLADHWTFRANPHYRPVPAERLTDAERGLLGDQDGLYGMLRPARGSGLDPRSCSADTALLFFTLAEPGPVPAFARAGLGPSAGRVLARLVVDGVLEVSAGDGCFRSGPQAASLLLPGRSAAGRGRVAELSVAALRHAQALPGASADALAVRLYRYGRRPVSSRLRRRLPDEAAVDSYLGLAPGGPAARVFGAAWTERSAASPAPWRYWARRGESEPGLTYKLYVSPAFAETPAALAAAAGVLGGTRGVTGFKAARDLGGLCRPDKLVAYFGRLDDLRAAAARLTGEIGGMPAQGVPFTAAVGLDGLLSWGADPPPGPAGPASWRTWVTGRLADYLLAARDADGPARDAGGPAVPARDAGGPAPEPWRFALERLRLTGVDTDTWVPKSGLWHDAPAAG